MIRGVSGKKRSKSQRIGELGEARFKERALATLGLTPNKTEYDYGVDAFCQVLKPGSNSEHVLGIVLAVQVKTVTGGKRNTRRVTLTRADVEQILKLEVPCCIVGVALKKKRLRFKFVDEGVVDAMIEFLSSGAGSMSWAHSKMSGKESEFRAELMELSKPGRQWRMRVRTHRRLLEGQIPGSNVRVSSSDMSGMGLVDVPMIGHLFDVSDDDWESVRAAIFDRGETPSPNLAGLSLKPSVDGLMRAIDGPLLLKSVVEVEAEVRIVFAGYSQTIPVTLRRVGDERCYVHRSGLAFVVSDARRREEGAFHDLGVRVSIENAVSLSDLGADDIEFFKLMRAGATLNFDGRGEVAIEHWFGALQIGHSVDTMLRVGEVLEIGVPGWSVGLLKDEEFAKALGLLEFILLENRPLEEMFSGFMFGDESPGEAEETIPVRHTGAVPIVVNLKDDGAVIWMDCEIDFMVRKGVYYGLKVVSGRRTGVEVFSHRRFSKSVDPEIWLNPDWPGIPMGVQVETICFEPHADREEIFATLEAIGEE